MYAVIASGGKQYKVQEGDIINVEKLAVAEGESLTIDQVLLVAKDGDVKVGTPTVAGASIVAKVIEHGKGDKVIAFRYKPKKSVRVKKGHRQPYTKLAIEKINA
ncbi:MAG: 50S ribosomal protein L21 [Peptococcaceae bacterium]|jgi:large subunit ribosomal protein L21|nr:50S ribosomal protein L21 [Peptococcaceae bacterium]